MLNRTSESRFNAGRLRAQASAMVREALASLVKSEQFRTVTDVGLEGNPTLLELLVERGTADLVAALDPAVDYEKASDGAMRERAARTAYSLSRNHYQRHLHDILKAGKPALIFAAARAELDALCDASLRRATLPNRETNPRARDRPEADEAPAREIRAYDWLMTLVREVAPASVAAGGQEGARYEPHLLFRAFIWPKIVEGPTPLRKPEALIHYVQTWANKWVQDEIDALSFERDEGKQEKYWRRGLDTVVSVSLDAPFRGDDGDDDGMVYEHEVMPAIRADERPEEHVLARWMLDEALDQYLDYPNDTQQNALGLLVFLLSELEIPPVAGLVAAGSGKNQAIASVIRHVHEHRSALRVYLSDPVIGLGLSEAVVERIVERVGPGFERTGIERITSGWVKNLRDRFARRFAKTAMAIQEREANEGIFGRAPWKGTIAYSSRVTQWFDGLDREEKLDAGELFEWLALRGPQVSRAMLAVVDAELVDGRPLRDLHLPARYAFDAARAVEPEQPESFDDRRGVTYSYIRLWSSDPHILLTFSGSGDLAWLLIAASWSDLSRDPEAAADIRASRWADWRANAADTARSEWERAFAPTIQTLSGKEPSPTSGTAQRNDS